MQRGRRRRKRRKLLPAPHAGFLLAGISLTAVLMGLATRSWGWSLPTSFVAAVNVVTLAAYGYDKAAARRGRLRVPEAVLHTFALSGGTPAAFLAQRWFRHKTVKGTFRIVFWSIASLQAVVLAWILWDGRAGGAH